MRPRLLFPYTTCHGWQAAAAHRWPWSGHVTSLQPLGICRSGDVTSPQPMRSLCFSDITSHQLMGILCDDNCGRWVLAPMRHLCYHIKKLFQACPPVSFTRFESGVHSRTVAPSTTRCQFCVCLRQHLFPYVTLYGHLLALCVRYLPPYFCWALLIHAEELLGTQVRVACHSAKCCFGGKGASQQKPWYAPSCVYNVDTAPIENANNFGQWILFFFSYFLLALLFTPQHGN